MRGGVSRRAKRDEKAKSRAISTDICTRNRSGRFRIGECDMQHSRPAASMRPASVFLPAMALTIVLTATTPGIGSGGSRGESADLKGLVREFNTIATELQKARGDLQSRALDERGFGDRILEL